MLAFIIYLCAQLRREVGLITNTVGENYGKKNHGTI